MDAAQVSAGVICSENLVAKTKHDKMPKSFIIGHLHFLSLSFA
jgi:hypothetical protein